MVKLKELVDFQNGYAFKSKQFNSGGEYPIIKIKELKDGKIKFFENSAKIDISSNDKLERYSIEKGDVLFALTGDPVSKGNPLTWVGRVAIYEYDFKSYLNQRVCKIVAKNVNVNTKYIYYSFIDYKNFYKLASKAKGSASQANISTKDIGEIELFLPNINIQRKVVSILDVIEKKIELNKRINDNLEAQAKVLYHNMVKNIEPNGILTDIANVVMGQSPKGTSYNEQGEGEIFFQGRTDFGDRFPSIRQYTTEPKRFADKGDILMSVRAPVGDINIANHRCCIGRGLASISSNDYHQSFVLYTMFSIKDALNVFNGEGTVFGSINAKSLKEMPIRIPSVLAIKEFEKNASLIDKLIFKNYEEISKLINIRDILLPKLMSGEIDVSNVDI